MKIQSLYLSHGNSYIGGICHKLSATSQVRLFTNIKKLKSLFPLKHKNLKNSDIIWDLRKDLISERKLLWVKKKLNTITQLDEHESLSSFFTQNIRVRRVYWVRRVMFLYCCREGHELHSLIKTTSSGQIQSDRKGATGLLPITFSET